MASCDIFPMIMYTSVDNYDVEKFENRMKNFAVASIKRNFAIVRRVPKFVAL